MQPPRFSFYHASKPMYTSRRNLPPSMVSNSKVCIASAALCQNDSQFYTIYFFKFLPVPFQYSEILCIIIVIVLYLSPLLISNFNCRSLIQSFPTDVSWIAAGQSTVSLESVLEQAPTCTSRSDLSLAKSIETQYNQMQSSMVSGNVVFHFCRIQ